MGIVKLYFIYQHTPMSQQMVDTDKPAVSFFPDGKTKKGICLVFTSKAVAVFLKSVCERVIEYYEEKEKVLLTDADEPAKLKPVK